MDEIGLTRFRFIAEIHNKVSRWFEPVLGHGVDVGSSATSKERSFYHWEFVSLARRIGFVALVLLGKNISFAFHLNILLLYLVGTTMAQYWSQPF